MTIEAIIEQEVVRAVAELYGATIETKMVQVQETKREIVGDKTVVIFPLLRFSKKTPEEKQFNKMRKAYLQELKTEKKTVKTVEIKFPKY